MSITKITFDDWFSEYFSILENMGYKNPVSMEWAEYYYNNEFSAINAANDYFEKGWNKNQP